MWSWLQTTSTPSSLRVAQVSSFGGGETSITYLSGVGFSGPGPFYTWIDANAGRVSSSYITANWQLCTTDYIRSDTAAGSYYSEGFSIGTGGVTTGFSFVDSTYTEVISQSSTSSFIFGGVWFTLSTTRNWTARTAIFSMSGEAYFGIIAWEGNQTTFKSTLTRNGNSWSWGANILHTSNGQSGTNTVIASTTSTAIPDGTEVTAGTVGVGPYLSDCIDGPWTRATSTTATATATRIGVDTTANPQSFYTSTFTGTYTSTTELTSYTLEYTNVRAGSWELKSMPPGHNTIVRCNRGEQIAATWHATQTTFNGDFTTSRADFSPSSSAITNVVSASTTTSFETLSSVSQQVTGLDMNLWFPPIAGTGDFAMFPLATKTYEWTKVSVISTSHVVVTTKTEAQTVYGITNTEASVFLCASTYSKSVFTISNGEVGTTTIKASSLTYVTQNVMSGWYGVSGSFTYWSYSNFGERHLDGGDVTVSHAGSNNSISTTTISELVTTHHQTFRVPGLMTGAGCSQIASTGYLGPFSLAAGRDPALVPVETEVTISGTTVAMKPSTNLLTISQTSWWTSVGTTGTSTANETATSSQAIALATATQTALRTTESYNMTIYTGEYVSASGPIAASLVNACSEFGASTILDVVLGKYTIRDSTGGSTTKRRVTESYFLRESTEQISLHSSIVAFAFEQVQDVPTVQHGALGGALSPAVVTYATT